MAYGTSWGFSRIFFLFFVIIVLILGGSLWFDYLGVIDVKGTYAPVFQLLGLGGRSTVDSPDSPDLLENERLSKLMVAVDLRAEELQLWEEAVRGRELDVLQQAAALDEQHRALQDQEKSLTESIRRYDNKAENLRQNATYLNSMPPRRAVAMLLAMDDQDMIDHLRMVEQLSQEAGEDSSVAFWFSLMPAERAATIQRKMVIRPRS